MKNQYVADVGDYGKYGLLREFINAGIKIGVNWYLTEDDDSNHGKFTKYLQDSKMRRYDPELFDRLQEISEKSDKSVFDIQKSGLLPDAVFYDALLKPVGVPKTRLAERKQWFENSIDIFSGVDLIFMDPDNGLMEEGNAGKRNAEKYVLPDEVEEYFKAGKNVVYYCQRGRRSVFSWIDYISVMAERIPEAMPAVLRFQKGTSRSFVFLIHQESYQEYRKILDKVCRKWERLFFEEYTNQGDVAGKKIGPVFSIENTNGVIVTLQKRADGQIEIKASDNPTTSHVLSADAFCRELGF